MHQICLYWNTTAFTDKFNASVLNYNFLNWLIVFIKHCPSPISYNLSERHLFVLFLLQVHFFFLMWVWWQRKREKYFFFQPKLSSVFWINQTLIRGKFMNSSKDLRHSLNLSKKSREKELAQAFQTWSIPDLVEVVI